MNRQAITAVLSLTFALAGTVCWSATARLSATEILEYETVELVLRSSHSTGPDVSELQ